jgi:hypothetical protein
VCASRAHLKHSSAIARYSLAVFMRKILSAKLGQILLMVSVYCVTYAELFTYTAICVAP